MIRPGSSSSPISVCVQLTRAIIHTERLDEIFEAALDAIAGGLQINRAAILLFDTDGAMRFKASRGISDAYRASVEGHTPWQQHARNVEPVVVADVTSDLSLAPLLPVFSAEQIAALTFIPLEGSDGLIGKFMLYFDRPYKPSRDELELASLIAAQVSFAVERTLDEAARFEAMEQSHRASRGLAAIVESSDDAIVSKNLDGIIMSWNRGAERMFGYTAEEAVGRSIRLIIPTERLAEEDVILSSIRGDRAVDIETVRQRKDGTRIDISLKVSPVKDSVGRIVGVSKIARDVTARKRFEAERAELHRRLTILVAASGALLDSPHTDAVRTATVSVARQLLVADGYAVWERHADPSAWRIVKFEGVSGEFAGRVIDSYRGGAVSAPLFTEPLAVEDIAAQPILSEQLAAYRDEGVRSMLVCPMKMGNRAATLVFYYRTPRTFSDVDVQTAQALANLAAVAMTTADLYERAHEANRLKDNFLATLSHELRTPLNAILGYAQMLSLDVLRAERRTNAVTVLTRNAEALRQIIDDVLDVSRITSGKLRLKVRPIALDDILRNAVATVQPAADAKGVNVTLILEEVQPISGDPDRLLQVIWNLLSNAVKFTPRGGHVQLRLEEASPWVQMTVGDDGQGIDPAFLPHIFERFRQGDSRFSREHGGLGLGLAIVRDLVELHGGSVSAVSDGPGTGATFTVRLPVLLPARQADADAGSDTIQAYRASV